MSCENQVRTRNGTLVFTLSVSFVCYNINTIPLRVLSYLSYGKLNVRYNLNKQFFDINRLIPFYMMWNVSISATSLLFTKHEFRLISRLEEKNNNKKEPIRKDEPSVYIRIFHQTGHIVGCQHTFRGEHMYILFIYIVLI